MICVSAVYENKAGSRFDAAYYVTTHSRLAAGLLEPHGLHALRVTLGEAALDGGPPPYWAISELHFPSRAAFDLAMSACGVALFEDSKNYTDVNPVLQVSTLAAERSDTL